MKSIPIDMINLTTTTIHSHEFSYDDNKEIIWPAVVGIFVALALGWMICRYTCSSEERSPHNISCCPKSLCKKIRLCCMWICSLCRLKTKSQQRTDSEAGISMKKESILDSAFIMNNVSSSLTQTNQAWSTSLLLNNNPNSSISIVNSSIGSSQPKRHPLRRESVVLEMDKNYQRESLLLWPFQTTDMVFHKQLNDIKKNSLFFDT